jgi:hypothetical protein
MNSTDGRTISDHETRTSITARRSPVVTPPASYCGGTEFKSRSGIESAYEFHGFYRVPPGKRQDSNSDLARPIPLTLHEVNLQQSPLTLLAVQPETLIATLRDPCKVWGTLLLCSPLIPNLATTWWRSASPGRTPKGTRRTGSWVGPRARLDASKRTRISSPCQTQTTSLRLSSPCPSRYKHDCKMVQQSQYRPGQALWVPGG